MRTLILGAGLAIAAAACAFSGDPELTLGAPALAVGAAAVVDDRKQKTVVEYVVYRGAFDDKENRQPVLSTPDLELARHARLNELHDAHLACKPDAVFSIGERVCTYPTDAKGKAQSHGSTVEENEVT